MQLIGSTTSPYARRLRIWLAEQNITHDFINLDIFSAQGRPKLQQDNPANKIPYLIDSEQKVYDSGVIFRYLSNKHQLPQLSTDEQNLLTIIDAANDSFIILLIAQRSDLELNQEKLLFKLQLERIDNALQALDQACGNHEFEQWNYLSISLYCLLDWLQFRDLYSLTRFPQLQRFYQSVQNKKLCKNTDPRK